MRSVALIVLLAAVPVAAAVNGVVVDHSMDRASGRFSDTEDQEQGGSNWQLVADDFQLGASETIRHVSWWGYYWLDVSPPSETIRIRFYDARPGDGLPGSIVWQEMVMDPSRIATGILVPVAGTHQTMAEYEFRATLVAPVMLDANTPYWLEIVQLGDLDTGFIWRGALADSTGTAYMNAQTGDWSRFLTFNTDSAFQLSTIPEPATLMFFAVGVGCVRSMRSNHQEVL